MTKRRRPPTPTRGGGDAFRRAVAAHKSGRLGEAERLYGRVLVAHPDHAEALHLRGLAAYQRGAGEPALTFMRRAIAIAPGVARYHNNLALVFAAAGRHELAEAACRRALALDPAYAEALVNLANALKERGALTEAVDVLRRAINARPDYAPAHNNLANLLKDQGRLDAAVDAYRAAIARDRRYVAAQYNLSVALVALGRLDEAEDACRRTLELAPRHAPAHNNLGNVLRFRGRIDAAIASFRAAIAIDPDFAAAHCNLAELVPARAGDAAFDRLERLRDRPTLPPHERISLDFALGRMYDAIGETDRAFDAYRAGNHLRAREAVRLGRGFDAADHRRRTDRLIETFSPDLFERMADSARDGADETPVFIVGMPRSGTTLVEQILASHPTVHGAGELAAIDRLIATLDGYPEAIAALDPASRRALGARYLEALRAHSATAARITDKLPLNLFNLGFIALILPGARVIHCRRDPRDTCLSCFTHDFGPGNEFSDDLADLAAFHGDYHRLGAHWRATLPLPMIEVRYEDLVADIEAESRRLIAFLGLEWDPRCTAFHHSERAVLTSSSAQVRQPIHGRAVGRWRRYERRLTPLIEGFAAAGVPLTR